MIYMNARFKSFLKYFSTCYKRSQVLFWLAGALFSMGLFVELTFEVINGRAQAIDEKILFNVINARTSLLNSAARDITALGSSTVIIIITVISLLVLFRKNKLSAVYVAFISIGSLTCSEFLKYFIDRDRPIVAYKLASEFSQSYPSGHSLVTTAVYLSYAFLLCRTEHLRSIRALIYSFACMIILLVSLSRVYLGVHYPSDVLSGVFFGVSWFLFSTALYKSVT